MTNNQKSIISSIVRVIIIIIVLVLYLDQIYHNTFKFNNLIILLLFVVIILMNTTLTIKYKKRIKGLEDMSTGNQREFSVDIVITTPKDITTDQLTDEIIEFVEDKGYFMGGAVVELDIKEPKTKANDTKNTESN